MRSKSIIITFDKTEITDELLNTMGIDWGLDGTDGQYKCYIHADGKYAVPDSLLDLLPHAMEVVNTWQGDDYLDAYFMVDNKPDDGLYIEHDEKFYKNVKFSELKSGIVSASELIYKRDILNDGTI